MCGWSLLGCSVSMRQGKEGTLNYTLYCLWEGVHGLALPPSACPMNRPRFLLCCWGSPEVKWQPLETLLAPTTPRQKLLGVLLPWY